jgi:hypothetical protein
MGAILAMINDARLAAGKRTIGFINPTIYSPSFQKAFNDVEIGSNPGCGTDGFSAACGWDPVTVGGIFWSSFLGLIRDLFSRDWERQTLRS